MQATLDRPQVLTDGEQARMDGYLKSLNLYDRWYMQALREGDSVAAFAMKLARDWFIRWFMARDLQLGCNADGYTLWKSEEEK